VLSSLENFRPKFRTKYEATNYVGFSILFFFLVQIVFSALVPQNSQWSALSLRDRVSQPRGKVTALQVLMFRILDMSGAARSYSDKLTE
jgi:hypothetical protein